MINSTNLGQNSIQALRLPGHTKGHYGFYIEEEGLLFSGDLDLALKAPGMGGELGCRRSVGIHCQDNSNQSAYIGHFSSQGFKTGR